MPPLLFAHFCAVRCTPALVMLYDVSTNPIVAVVLVVSVQSLPIFKFVLFMLTAYE